MKNKASIPSPKSLSRSFTLIELIVVIIIVGILAAVGITQYSKTVEKGRGAEARIALGHMRDLASLYWLKNGTTTGMTYTDLNIGIAAGQFPGTGPESCASTYYFYYNIAGTWSDIPLIIRAYRCTSGGKSPQGPSGGYLFLTTNFSTGTNTWSTSGY